MYIRNVAQGGKWRRISYAKFLEGNYPKPEWETKHEETTEAQRKQRKSAHLLRTIMGCRGNLCSSSNHLSFRADLTDIELQMVRALGKINLELKEMEALARKGMRNLKPNRK